MQRCRRILTRHLLLRQKPVTPARWNPKTPFIVSLGEDGGAELTAVRDNLRHASITTTSMYLHGDDIQRARQMHQAFAARK